MDTINTGYENRRAECLDTRNIRIYMHHFHPSIIFYNSVSKYELKIGASAMMYLTKFAIDNDNYKEEKTLLRITGSTKDMQNIHNYENENKEGSNNKILAIVTPTRDSYNNKRHFELLQLEEKK